MPTENNLTRRKRQDVIQDALRRLWPLVLPMLLPLLACNLGQDRRPLPTNAPVALSVERGNRSTQAITTPDATVGLTFAPIVTMTAAGPTATTAVDRCAAVPNESIIKYDIDTTINYQNHVANVSMKATYRNDTGDTLQLIVFHVDPNNTPGLFTLSDVSADSPANVASFTLTGSRLEVALSNPLITGCRVTINLKFIVRVAALSDARMIYLEYSDHQLTLGNWLPEIAQYIHKVWVTPRPWNIGEYTVSEMGDFKVHVTLQGASDRTDVIGPGDVTRIDDHTWQFEIARARTFTLCVSDALFRMDTKAQDGTEIDLYYSTKNVQVKLADGTTVTPAQHALDTARTAADRFSNLFGALDNKRLVVIEGDFKDGMEFSGLIFVSHQWFKVFDGKPDSWLTLITAHEVAHQWWYSRVSDDQGETPYLDEAFAVYSELLYIEKQYPTLVSWWWLFRVKLYQPIGLVDTKVWEYNNPRLYINAVYLRGALMFQEIRDTIGTEAFLKWWRDFGDANANKIAHPTDLWRAMSSDDYARIASIRLKYLRQPDPLSPLTSPTATPAPVLAATSGVIRAPGPTIAAK